MKMLIIYGVAALAVLILGGLFMWALKRRPRRMDIEYYTKRWVELQKNCATRKTWPLSIIDADNLLDDALKRRHYKGKTAGERLVAAQHELTANDRVWFAHKLRNRIVHEDVRKLKKQDVMDALTGFRQALKDLGALKND